MYQEKHVSLFFYYFFHVYADKLNNIIGCLFSSY